MKKKQILGLTGSMQSGKQELRPLFESHGYVFVDLNRIVNLARLLYPRVYRSRGLNVTNDGSEGPGYYATLAASPTLHRRIQAMENDFVIRQLAKHLDSIDSDKIVLSWGYLYQLLGFVPVDHLLLFRSDPPIWIERIRKKAASIGFEMTHAQVNTFAKDIEMDPVEIARSIASKIPADRLSVIDTSAEDYNKNGVDALLGKLTA
ncbi:MAG: hypothetical protein HGA38_04610 [Candidatus Moranbacteria bacterium]|nr:hypothetical protein [Candidatus Moranbacteria bacterium]